MKIVKKGSLFSMFNTIKMCVGLKLLFFQANGIFGFGGLNLFCELSGVDILAHYFVSLPTSIKWVFISSNYNQVYNHVLCCKIAHCIS
jgi:hypothetical protein